MEVVLNAARKIEAILNAWFDYIALDDYSNARVETNSDNSTVRQRGIKLVRDHILVEPATFSELRQQVTKKPQSQQEATWVLSFPQVLDVEKRKSYLCPLFCLDVTSIFQGEHQQQGWNLDSLKLTEAGDNLATFLGLDDEQCEQLITQDGLRRFLETTFELAFETYEEWMHRVVIPRSRYQIQRQPYLFEFKGGRFSENLRRDFKDIKSDSKAWLKPKHPAYEYLFDAPVPPKHKVTYLGAFPTNAPTKSQLTVLKHAQSEPVTAVQGPPGSGKTTLILHIIAQQVVKRALSIIETGEDINNLTVISSTNNKAVDNVIDKLESEEFLRGKLFYLKGGNRDNISKVAKPQLQKALNFLSNSSFDENNCRDLARQIQQIKQDLISQENQYLESQRQHEDATIRLPKLQNIIQDIQYLRQI